jgi:hypothetical protein
MRFFLSERCWSAMAFVLALIGFCSPAAAQPYTSFPDAPPQIVAEPGGTFTIAWGAGGTLLVSSGSPERGFSSPYVISEPGDDTGLGALAADAAGDEIVVWGATRAYNLNAPGPTVLSRGSWYALKPAGGLFSRPRRLAAPSDTSVGSCPGTVDLAVSRDGQAVLGATVPGDTSSLYLRFGDVHSGVFGAPVRIEAGTGSHPARLYYVGYSAAGELMVVSQGASGIEARFAAPHGRFGPPQLVAPFATCPVVAYGSRGDALIAFTPDFRSVGAAYRHTGRPFAAPQVIPSVNYMESATIDGQGRALLTLRTGGFSGQPEFVDIARSDATGRFSPPAPLLAPTRSFGDAASLAGDSNGDAAIGYLEASPITSVTLGTPTAMFLQTSIASGRFSAPLTLAYGTVNGVWPNVDARLPVLSVSNGPRFTAVWVPPMPATTFDVEDWTLAGASPIAQLPITPPQSTIARDNAASVVDLGATAPAGHHHKLTGTISCGSEPPAACMTRIKITQIASPYHILAQTTLTIPATQRETLNLALTRTARRLLTRHRTITATMTTLTSNRGGPVTRDDYPLIVSR